MPKPATTLLNGDASQLNQTGTAQRAAGYYSTAVNGGWHTISADLVDFTGRIVIEATLVTEPVEADWFPVQLTSANAGADIDGGTADNASSYAQYPQDPANPTGAHGDTGTFGWTLRGNFVWIRARTDRSYLADTSNVGNARKILMVV
jgi:hypothetical protein